MEQGPGPTAQPPAYAASRCCCRPPFSSPAVAVVVLAGDSPVADAAGRTIRACRQYGQGSECRRPAPGMMRCGSFSFFGGHRCRLQSPERTRSRTGWRQTCPAQRRAFSFPRPPAVSGKMARGEARRDRAINAAVRKSLITSPPAQGGGNPHAENIQRHQR